MNQLLFAAIIFHNQQEINWLVLAYFRDYDVIICEVLISEPFDDCFKVILENHMFLSMENTVLAFPILDFDVRICATLSVHHTPNVDEGLDFFDGLLTNCNWYLGSSEKVYI